MADSERLNVSLEPHLQDVLTSIQDLTPPKLADDLASYLSSERDRTTVGIIPYTILQKVSRWSQTSEGTKVLQGCSPQLDPQSYTMISLLAGTCTSPEKRFPPYIPSGPLEERRRAIDDRNAISTVMNGVLSVVGTGAATWWASDRTGLKLEWVSRILLLRGATVVNDMHPSESPFGCECCCCRGVSRDYFVHDLGFSEVAQVEEHSATRHHKDRKGWQGY